MNSKFKFEVVPGLFVNIGLIRKCEGCEARRISLSGCMRLPLECYLNDVEVGSQFVVLSSFSAWVNNESKC